MQAHSGMGGSHATPNRLRGVLIVSSVPIHLGAGDSSKQRVGGERQVWRSNNRPD